MTKYLIDTNVIYYALGIEKDGIYKYDLSASGDWRIADIALFESINKYQNDQVKFEILAEFFKSNESRVIKYTLDEYDVMDIFKLKFGSVDWKAFLGVLIEKKRNLEAAGLHYVNALAVIACANRSISKQKLQAKEASIWMTINNYLKSNEAHIRKCIREKIDAFYQSGEESHFKSDIQKLILISLWVSLYGLLAAKYGMDIQTCQMELAKSPSKIPPNDPDVIFIEKITDLISDEEKRKKKWFKAEAELNESLELIESAASQFPEMPLGLHKYLKLILAKIFTTGKKIHKNDFLDSLLLLEYPDALIATADGDFAKIIASMDAEYWVLCHEYLDSLRSPIAKIQGDGI